MLLYHFKFLSMKTLFFVLFFFVASFLLLQIFYLYKENIKYSNDVIALSLERDSLLQSVSDVDVVIDSIIIERVRVERHYVKVFESIEAMPPTELVQEFDSITGGEKYYSSALVGEDVSVSLDRVRIATVFLHERDMLREINSLLDSSLVLRDIQVDNLLKIDSINQVRILEYDKLLEDSKEKEKQSRIISHVAIVVGVLVGVFL